MTSETAPQGFEKIPQHIAIIMDGNGRWAKKRGLPRLAGHRAGTEALRTIIRASADIGIKYLTFYAFSTENWARPKAEVTGLMNILAEVIDKEMIELDKEGVRMVHIGHLEGLPVELQKKVSKAVEMTKNNRRITVVIAFNYGGRDEIVYAVRRILGEGVSPDDVDADLLSSHMFTAGIPDPDMVIRTSGEQRISNFLTWQSVYSELYFPEVFWPDFDEEELRKALEVYAGRERRYGGLQDT